MPSLELAGPACSASNSRVFSMAITAWSAKVATSSICLSVNGREWRAATRGRQLQHRRAAGELPASTYIYRLFLIVKVRILAIGQNIGYVHGALLKFAVRPISEPRMGSMGFSIAYLNEIRARMCWVARADGNGLGEACR